MSTLRDLIEGDDLDVFIDAEDGFAQQVTFNGTYGALTIAGIFEQGLFAPNDYSGAVEHAPPSITCKTAALKGVKPHDTVTVGLVVYEVIEIDDSRRGLTTLTLNKLRDDS